MVLHLLALNLQRPTAINCAINGNFSAPKVTEIVVSRGNILELLRPDDQGKIISVCSTHVFSVIRSLMPFRLQGANRDYIVIGSDSGKISVVEFSKEENQFKTVHCEVYGKTGCRRIVPGQYLACDPRGRAIMIGAIEKQKFVYVMHRDAANRLTISSPLEAHKSDTIVFSICGVDNGYENPIFAMIELDYSEADKDYTGEAVSEAEKHLTYYELDLGLNHVTRKWSEPISRTANILLTVPGGSDGPSGVLVCGENWVAYKHQGHREIRTALPRRRDMPDTRGLLITAGVTHKSRDRLFFLLQSEIGDLYKVNLDLDPENPQVVINVRVSVFDTVEVANALCVTKSGLLFVASEFSNHSLYQFATLENEIAVSESITDEQNETLGDDAVSASVVAPRFTPSKKLQHLIRIDNMDSLAPITDMLIEDLAGEGTPQLYTLCGRGNRSSLRVLRHGITVSEIAVTELPGRAKAVWTIKQRQDAQFDSFIIVSFNSVTLVMSIGDTVVEVTNSGFLGSVSTLEAALLYDNSFVQVHTLGIRHIKPDGRVSEWRAPGKKEIEYASANPRQVAVSLSGCFLVYFELDAGGNLVTVKEQEMDRTICCLSVGEVLPGRAKSMFLAMGSIDQTVSILSLDRNDLLISRSVLQLSSRPESCCIVEMASDRGASAASTLFLNVGQMNGVCTRAQIDTTGSLSDTRQRFLGVEPVKLIQVQVQGRRGVLALSQRAWLSYNFQGRFLQAPISYERLEHASNFASELCAEGVVAVAGNTLRIFSLENFGAVFNAQVIPLRYTPRRICAARTVTKSFVVIIESDHNEFNEEERRKFETESVPPPPSHPNGATVEMDMDMDMDTQDNGHNVETKDESDDEDEDGAKLAPIRGALPPIDGKWASCIRVLDPTTGDTLELIELGQNEAALSVCVCKFTAKGEESFIVVGSAKDMLLHPRHTSVCFLNVYRMVENRLVLLHKTEVEDVPYAMAEFNGRLLVGVGKSLRLYDMGKKKLLKKSENKSFPNIIVKLHTMYTDRIYVCDAMESVHFVKFKRNENTFVVFADDHSPRYITASALLDYETIAAADKFGNVFTLRLPANASDDMDNPTGSRILWDQGQLNGAPYKLEQLTHYYLGEMVTTMHKAALVPGGQEAIICGTVMGGIFAFVPFMHAKADMDFYQQMEMFLRQETSNLVQRDCLSYRSYFLPVKETVDGDLCETFTTLPPKKQQEVAADVERSIGEVLKKLEDTRNTLL